MTTALPRIRPLVLKRRAQAFFDDHDPLARGGSGHPPARRVLGHANNDRAYYCDRGRDDVLPESWSTDSWKILLYPGLAGRRIFHEEVAVQRAADRVHSATG